MMMIVTVRRDADPDLVRRALVDRGLWVRSLRSQAGTSFWVESHSSTFDAEQLRFIEGVAEVAHAESEHPRVDAHPPTVDVGGLRIGATEPPVLVAGPCSVESEAHVRRMAEHAHRAGARVLRGGAYKPRTSPYSFQGHGERALGWIRQAADAYGLKVVTELMSVEDAAPVSEHADLLQIGSRNMQNYALLRVAGGLGRPVLLKRGMAATVEEWLLAAEYLLVHGAPGILFCERGVRGFDPTTRNLLDLGAVAIVAHALGLPVIADPSHATGRRDLVLPLSRAAVAAGAAGVMVEAHDRPGAALSDGAQALSPADLERLGAELLGTARRTVPPKPRAPEMPLAGGPS